VKPKNALFICKLKNVTKNQKFKKRDNSFFILFLNKYQIGDLSLFICNSQYNSSSLTFGTTRKKTVVDKKIANWNHTDFFRTDINWPRFITELDNKYPNGAKINCYACSDGSEAYSIALKLIQQLGLKKAQKFFPIIAKDIDKEQIEKDKKGIVGLRKTIDIPEMKRCLKDTNIKIDDIIEPANIEPEKVFGVYNYEIGQYKVKGFLKDVVKFETANIVEDTNKKFPENSVVLFRNAVPYLSPEQEKQLVQNLDKNLSAGNLVVIGGFDQDYSCIAEHLANSSFHVVDSDNPMVYTRRNLKAEFPLGIQYRDNPLMAGLFEKD